MSLVLEAEERYAHRHSVKLARRVAQAHPDFYVAAPLARLVLEIRGLSKVAARFGIRDPDMLTDLVVAIFDPHPSALSEQQRETVASLLSNGATDAQSRCRAVRTHLASRHD